MITSESFLSKSFSKDLKASEDKLRHVLSRKLFLHIFAFCEVVIDFLTCTTVIFLASMVQSHIGAPTGTTAHTSLLLGTVAGGIVVILMRSNCYGPKFDAVQETAEAIRASFYAITILSLTRFLLQANLSFGAVVIGFILVPPVLMLQKEALDWVIRKLHNSGHGADRVVIYGAGETGWRIASALLVSPRCALRPVAIIDENSQSIETCGLEMAYRENPEIAVECVPITADLLQKFHCELLIVASKLSEEQQESLRVVAKYAGARVAYCSDNPGVAGEATECIVQGLQLAYVETTRAPWHYTCSKRIFDFCGSSILLVLLSPVFLLIAFLIRLTSPGPSLFVQKRVGRNGVHFKMYKFRSMSYRAHPYENSPKSSHDPRITAIGRFLRRTSLDELPQLFNVFLGQMSLVGPRPEMPFIVRRYNSQQRRRLEVTPGITGLWQLSMDRAYPIHENLHHDFSYIRRRAFSLDLAILVHTLFFAMRGGI